MRAAVALGVVALVVAALPAVAQEGGDVVRVPSSRDFATIELGDPWDYANDGDILTDPNGPTLNVSGMQVAEGQASWSGDDLSYVSPHDMTIPGALPDSRDGLSNPIDANTYRRLGMRLFSSKRVAGGLQWFVCNDYSAECLRFHNFTFEQGWNLYDIDLSAVSGDWRDVVLGLRLAIGPASDLQLDWLRIHTDGQDVAAGSGPFTITAVDPEQDGAGGPTTFRGDAVPTGALAPGTWDVRDGSGAATRIEVRDSPRPVVLDPDPAGGDDHAVVVRGDAWDFSQASDWDRLANVDDAILDDGVLQGTNRNDNPHVELALGGPIDTDRFHRMTVTMTYDGEFDLGFEAGGGSHGRAVFDHLGGAFTPISSKELVTYQSRPTATWDLTSDLVGPAVEDGAAAFDAAPVSFLRWDPNEDPGRRTWRLDEIRLTADDQADGVFPFRWRDDSWDDGRTVRIGLDTDRRGFDGPTVVANGGPGERTSLLLTDQVIPGTMWPWLEITDGDDVRRAYARGPLVVSGRIAGPDRLATAVALSQTAFESGAATAIVASARSFPDALAGVALASAADAPILLTERDTADPRVLSEIRRLDVDEVIVLGGTSAVSGAVVAAIEDAHDVTVERLAGSDRYATAATIAREAAARWTAAGVEGSDEVILASGASFPDALAAGQLAAAAATPIVLTRPDRLSDAAAEVLDELDPGRVVAIGGSTALSDRATSATGRPVDRLAGTDRFATAVAVRDRAIDAGADETEVVLSSGRGFPDALAAGPYVARRGGTLLLTEPTVIPAVVRDQLVVGHLVVVGGRAAVSDAVLGDARSIAYAGGVRSVLRAAR